MKKLITEEPEMKLDNTPVVENVKTEVVEQPKKKGSDKGTIILIVVLIIITIGLIIAYNHFKNKKTEQPNA